jgi:hypothetical protein
VTVASATDRERAGVRARPCSQTCGIAVQPRRVVRAGTTGGVGRVDPGGGANLGPDRRSRFDSIGGLHRIFVFPHDDDSPTCTREQGLRLVVSGDVPLQLLAPPGAV